MLRMRALVYPPTITGLSNRTTHSDASGASPRGLRRSAEFPRELLDS